jgi:hypothetical protein
MLRWRWQASPRHPLGVYDSRFRTHRRGGSTPLEQTELSGLCASDNVPQTDDTDRRISPEGRGRLHCGGVGRVLPAATTSTTTTAAHFTVGDRAVLDPPAHAAMLGLPPGLLVQVLTVRSDGGASPSTRPQGESGDHCRRMRWSFSCAVADCRAPARKPRLTGTSG